MTDPAVTGLARALDANWVHLLRPLGGQKDGMLASAAAILAELTPAEARAIARYVGWRSLAAAIDRDRYGDQPCRWCHQPKSVHGTDGRRHNACEWDMQSMTYAPELSADHD